MDFAWKGSICANFEEDEMNSMNIITKMIETSLQSNYRKKRSISCMERRQRHLENLLNEQILRLDMHISGLKYDKRALQNLNIGLAAFLTEQTDIIEMSSKTSDEFIQQKRKEFEISEKQRVEEFSKEKRELEEELKELSNENEKMEKKLLLVEDETKELQERELEYAQYEEWQKLNQEQAELSRELEKMEKALKGKDNFFN